MDSVGIIIANLGSPASPSRKDVARFLGEFLSDPYVIDIPTPFRQILAKGIIAPTRSKPSSKAYQSIWGAEGGPLRRLTAEIAEQIQTTTKIHTEVGMRYGIPSLRDACEKLRDREKVVLALLYPQHADSTRTTTIEFAQRFLSKDQLIVTPVYFDTPGYLDVLQQVTQDHLEDGIEHLVISFHSLPERHITKADPTDFHCLKSSDCCEVQSIAHETCYRHQCRNTAKSLGDALGIPYTVSFQSRLGRLPWLEPATDQVIPELAQRGNNHIAVVCPSFVVDNLETLEEIGIQAVESFQEHGGTKLKLIPCINTDQRWLTFFSDFIIHQVENAFR